MKDYKRIFRPTDEAGHLDNVSRRYAWFRRLLKVHEDDHAAIFPSGWQVGEVLVGVFAIQTRYTCHLRLIVLLILTNAYLFS